MKNKDFKKLIKGIEKSKEKDRCNFNLSLKEGSDDYVYEDQGTSEIYFKNYTVFIDFEVEVVRLFTEYPDIYSEVEVEDKETIFVTDIVVFKNDDEEIDLTEYQDLKMESVVKNFYILEC